MTRPVKRFLPLILLIVALVLAIAFDLPRYARLDTLREHREALLDFVAAYPLAAPLVFIGVYTGWVALSIPGAFLLTVAAGFLFGTVQGALLVVVGGTLGATAIFLAVRYALADLLRAYAGRWLDKLQAGFNRNAFNYLLVLRLAPIFPFFAINIATAFLNVPTGTFVRATLLGIIPACFVYASVGAGLGSILDAGGELDAGTVLTPEVILALSALAALSLLPVAIKRFRRD
jgi:uncharacterized membrane protein YdjX (TVP38/TMEM64 family)